MNRIKIWGVAAALLLSAITFSRSTEAIESHPLSEPDRQAITIENVDHLSEFEVLQHQSAIHSLAFSPDGSTLAVGTGNGWGEAGAVYLWDVESWRGRAVMDNFTAWVRSVAYNSAGTLLAAGSGDRTIQLWDTTTNEPVYILEGLGDAVRGNLTITDDDGTVTHPDVFSDAVWSVSFSPNGTVLAAARGDPWVGPGSYQCYSMASGMLLMDVRPIREASTGLIPMNLSVYDVAFSPDGVTLALVNGDLDVQLWEAADGRKRADLQLDEHSYAVSIAFSPDGSLLASAGNWTDCTGWGQVCEPDDSKGEVRLWDTLTGEVRAVYETGPGGMESVAFSPDGRLLAAGDWNGVWLLEVETGNLVSSSELQTAGGAAAIAFSPDGSMLAFGDWEGVVRLWGVPES